MMEPIVFAAYVIVYPTENTDERAYDSISAVRTLVYSGECSDLCPILSINSGKSRRLWPKHLPMRRVIRQRISINRPTSSREIVNVPARATTLSHAIIAFACARVVAAGIGAICKYK
jgi:hypothetical protein